MGQHIKQSEKELADLEAQQQELLEKINRTSLNSSSPPSLDPPNTEKRQEKKKSGKKRGGQPGHKGHSRFLYEPKKCEEVLNHHPETCSCCGEILLGEDAFPYRHQIVEIPPIKPIVIEHRLHQLVCNHCGTSTRAALPADVNPRGYGVRVVALVAVLSGLYRHSQRMVPSAMTDVFGVPMSLVMVNKLRLEASAALESVVESAKIYVQTSPVVGADETHFVQRNVDGCNEKNRQAWLWVAVTTPHASSRQSRPTQWLPLVAFFEIALSRCSDAARNLRS